MVAADQDGVLLRKVVKAKLTVQVEVEAYYSSAVIKLGNHMNCE